VVETIEQEIQKIQGVLQNRDPFMQRIFKGRLSDLSSMKRYEEEEELIKKKKLKVEVKGDASGAQGLIILSKDFGNVILPKDSKGKRNEKSHTEIKDEEHMPRKMSGACNRHSPWHIIQGKSKAIHN